MNDRTHSTCPLQNRMALSLPSLSTRYWPVSKIRHRGCTMVHTKRSWCYITVQYKSWGESMGIVIRGREGINSRYHVAGWVSTEVFVGASAVVTASRIECMGTGVRNGMPSDGEGFGAGFGLGLGSTGSAFGGLISSSLSFGGLMDGIGGSGKSHDRGT